MSLPSGEPPQSTAPAPLPAGPPPRPGRRAARRVLSGVTTIAALACFGFAAAVTNGDLGGHSAGGQDIGSAICADGAQHAVDTLLTHAGAGVPAR